MPLSRDALEDRLFRENEEYRDLHDKHQSFEERLEKLNARSILSDEEKVEAVRLKKQKLALKDRMAEIERGFSTSAPRAGS